MVRTLDRDSGDPGLPAGAPLGRYSGCSHGTQDQKSARHAPGISLGVFRECRGECEEEEAEQLQPLPRAVVGHRRSSHCTWALTQDGRSRRSMANVRRSTTRPIPFGGRSARVPREHDAREGREEGRQVARRDRSRSSRLRTRHSDTAAWTWSLLVRRD